ncbi:MAG: Gfo/Idh/MocA family protein [Candidatus Hodarchaeota archaeon]
MVQAALIGCGYWGSKLKKYIEADKHFNLVHVCDSKTDMDKVWPDVEAVIIATPIHTHYEVTRKALGEGKHVFVEKPLAKTVSQCLELERIAQAKKLVLCVDYIWMFSERLRKAREIDFGDIKYVDIVILRPKRKGTIENDYWLLGTHALTMKGMFLSKHPGVCVFRTGGNFRRTTIAILGTKRSLFLDLEGEKDNLKRAINYFYQALKGKARSNVSEAIEITRALQHK